MLNQIDRPWVVDGVEHRKLDGRLLLATDALHRHDLDAALPVLESEAGSQPDFDLAQLWRANGFMAQGQTTEAVELLQGALERCPRKSYLLKKLAEIYLTDEELRDHTKTVRYLGRSAYAGDPGGNSWAHLVALFDLAGMDEAKDFALEELEARCPEERVVIPAITERFGLAFSPSEHRPLLQEIFRMLCTKPSAQRVAAIRKWVDNAEGSNEYDKVTESGKHLYSLGSFTAAVRYIQKAERIDPDRSKKHGISMTVEEQEHLLRQKARLEECTQKLNEAQSEFARGDYAAAVECTRPLIESQPFNAAVWSSHGVFLGKKYERDTDLRNPSEEGLQCLVDAERALLRALELDPYLPQAHNNLGLVHTFALRAEQAVACYRRALELDPDYRDARTNLDSLSRRGADIEPDNRRKRWWQFWQRNA